MQGEVTAWTHMEALLGAAAYDRLQQDLHALWAWAFSDDRACGHHAEPPAVVAQRVEAVGRNTTLWMVWKKQKSLGDNPCLGPQAYPKRTSG